jgi:hypothetical protein
LKWIGIQHHHGVRKQHERKRCILNMECVLKLNSKN